MQPLLLGGISDAKAAGDICWKTPLQQSIIAHNLMHDAPGGRGTKTSNDELAKWFVTMNGCPPEWKSGRNVGMLKTIHKAFVENVKTWKAMNLLYLGFGAKALHDSLTKLERITFHLGTDDDALAEFVTGVRIALKRKDLDSTSKLSVE